jgi:hypothetical protein
MMRLRNVAIAGVASIALGFAPINSASAHWHGGGPLFWPFALGAAVVTGAAIIATAPLRAVAPPPAAYYPPPPVYYAPPAYYPPPGYYAPPPGYYGH